MPWGKMDDKFHRNRKVRELRRLKGGREALGTWVYWWSWCLDDPELTGVVPESELSAADARSAELLVSVGLWDRVADGYAFHDFAEYNPSRTQLDKKRTADRERVAAKRAESRADVARDNASDSRATVDATRDGVAATRASRPVPSRPDPVAAAAESSELPLTSIEVSSAWNAAMGNHVVGGMHGESQWREDYETIAAVLKSQPGSARVALKAVCEYFWAAPEGPVQSSRVPRGAASPKLLAKHLNRDLEAARSWWFAGGREAVSQQRPGHAEAAQ